jgi:murein DD-endopeptidase MepM/ murein hydrolase activator NlpD
MKLSRGVALAALCLGACTQQQLAKVSDKGGNYYGRGAGQTVAQGNFDLRNEVEVARAAPTDLVSTYDLDPVAVEVQPLSAPVVVASPDPVRVAPSSVPFASAPAPVVAQSTEVPQPVVVTDKELGPLFDLSELESATQQMPVLESKPLTPPAGSEGLIWPVEGEIISGFGKKQNGLSNDGINIKARMGEPIWAASSGEVVYAGNELKGYGNMVILKHGDGMMTSYAHASDVLVNKGQHVAQGDLLGYVGRSGSVTEPQLHFGIRMGKNAVNPESKLPRRLASNG